MHPLQISQGRKLLRASSQIPGKARKYIFFSFQTTKEADQFTKFVDETLGEFQFFIKGWNISGRKPLDNDPTLDNTGRMPLAGYKYCPALDTFQLKAPLQIQDETLEVALYQRKKRL